MHSTKDGGGFGDSKTVIRGFKQDNVAVMINGVPMNGMENNKVYWSNWAGLSDVTRSMQVQRGLGASKVASPAVGGSINVITKSTEATKVVSFLMVWVMMVTTKFCSVFLPVCQGWLGIHFIGW